VARVAVYESNNDDHRVASALREEGFEITSCQNSEALLEEVVQHRPGAVVYGLGEDYESDLGVLRLLRRIAPQISLVLLGGTGSLAVQRQLRSLSPVYLALDAADPAELREAVRAGLDRCARVQDVRMASR
jgi:DNA-binding response OmpR family regulator